MDLTKFIMKSCIVADMEVATKADALKELTNLLFDKKKMDGSGPALDQIMAREVCESTGIGKGIAVPHTRVTGMKGLACAVGRVKGGLEFHAIDRKPVHLVFLICYSPSEQTTYLNFVATVAKLLSDPEDLKEMMQAESDEAIYEILHKASLNFAELPEKRYRSLKTDPSIEQITDAHADIILLARLQLCEEMLANTRTGKKEIKQRIENIRDLVCPKIMSHYDRLCKARKPALVPVEGDTCQGCFMKLPSQFVQKVRQDPDHIHTCTNCSRYIYVV